MPNFRALIGLLLIPLAVAVGTGAMAHKTSPAPASCEIRTTKSHRQILLEAVASGPEKLTGEYEFAIVKSGGGGTSDIRQGGDFEIGPESESILGEVTIGSGEGASVRGALSLTKAGKLLCQAKFPERN